MATTDERPTTPTQKMKTLEEGDIFEDAPDITPRPRARSPDATRSLTDRRSSNPASNTETVHKTNGVQGAVEHSAPGNGTPMESIKEDEKSQPQEEHRISVTDLDEVNLEDVSQTLPAMSRSITQTSTPLQITEDTSRSSSTARSVSPSKQIMSAPTSGLPSMPKGFKSPFSWLSRATSGDKKAPSPLPVYPSPPLGRERQNTAASADLLVGQFRNDRDSEGKRDSGDSLRDRFKEARYAAETGLPFPGSENTPPTGGALAGLRSVSMGLGLTSPTALSPEHEQSGSLATPTMPHSPSSPGPTSRKPSMASTTAISAPPVDWDLWQSVVYEGPAAVARTSPEELNAALASGIPHPIRGVVWQVLAASKNEDLERLYDELVARGTEKEKSSANGHISLSSVSSKDKDSIASSASSLHSEHSTPATTAGAMSPTSTNGDAEDMSRLQNGLLAAKPRSSKDEILKIQKLEKLIKRDLGSRTAYSRFEAAKDSEGLFGVCKAYALYDEAVGYAQGMNFIAQPLLLNMSRAEAFSLFVRLMSKYGMREMFIQDMPGLHKHLYQFERLLEDFEPAVYCHLNRKGVNANLYATQWFLTLFAYRFPLDMVLRVYDLVLSEGLGAILKFGLVLMQRNRDALLEMKDMAQLNTFLKERIFDVYMDRQPSQKSILEAGFFGSGGGDEVYRVDVFVEDATSVKVTTEMLEGYTAEWEEKVRVERERDVELDTLRKQNKALTKKVRSLEDSNEKLDLEHITVASELIRTKVANESLQDANESLEGQVGELKNVVQHQTEEVEARMKDEVEAVKAANVAVHARNRELEEESEEATSEIIRLKMRLATVEGEFEGLRQRWRGVGEMFNGK